MKDGSGLCYNLMVCMYSSHMWGNCMLCEVAIQQHAVPEQEHKVLSVLQSDDSVQFPTYFIPQLHLSNELYFMSSYSNCLFPSLLPSHLNPHNKFQYNLKTQQGTLSKCFLNRSQEITTTTKKSHFLWKKDSSLCMWIWLPSH